MTDNRNEQDVTETGQEAAQDFHRLPLAIHSHYIKDLSMENPNAPATLIGGQGRPSMEVDFSVDAKKLKLEGDERDNLFEVTLGVRAAATRGGKPAFLVELQYATLVSVAPAVPKDQVHPLLLIEIPRLAFPFARQIVAEVTQQAGYLPFMLTPIDFNAFYAQRFASRKEAVSG